MVTVTVTPWNTIANNVTNYALERIQDRYSDASMEPLVTDPGRYSLSLPSKNKDNWVQDDADFFNQLVDDENVLVGWAILGGWRGMA